MTADKQGVIEDYRAAYSDFRMAIEGLTGEQLTKPFLDGWTVREVVGHIAGWHDQLGQGLRRIAEGQRPTPEGVDWSDVDGWNVRFAGDVSGADPMRLLQDLDSKVAEFAGTLQGVPDDRFGENKTVNRMADGAGAHHFREHAEQINEARAAGRL